MAMILLDLSVVSEPRPAWLKINQGLKFQDIISVSTATLSRDVLYVGILVVGFLQVHPKLWV